MTQRLDISPATKSRGQTSIQLAGLVAATGLAMLHSSARADADLQTVVDGVANVTTETFSSSSGDVLDGCISPGTHRLMRFNFRSRNIGDATLTVGPPPPRPPTCAGPGGASPIYVWSSGHCHYHIKDFNTYSLLRPNATFVTSGFKQAFCLMDVTHWDTTRGPATSVFDCTNQGVSVGWEDVYGSSLPCQYMPMNSVPDGEYRLVASTDVSRVVTEDSYTNNTVSIPIRLAGNTVTTLAPSWQTFESLGGVGSSAPTVVSWGPNRLDVFVVGPLNNLFHRFWNGSSWSAYTNIGGDCRSAPAAVAMAPNRIDVFVRGPDNALWQQTFNGSSWSGFVSRGGAFSGKPTVVSMAPNRVDVFVRGTDNALWQNGGNGSTWGGWGSHGGLVTSSPVAVSSARNKVDVFARGNEGFLWRRTWNGSSWAAWTSHGGALATGDVISAVSQRPGSMDVFVRATDSALWRMARNNGTWSGSWEALGGALTSPPSAVSWGNGRVDVFVKSTDNALWQRTFNGSSWSAWASRGGAVSQVGSAVSWAVNRIDAFVLGSDGAVWRRVFF